MKQVVIENPVLNSPFGEPNRHFRFDDDGITDEVIAGRRISSYFVPIPRPKKRGKQLTFDTEWTEDRIKENEFINRVRGRVSIWRQGGYPGVTRTTAQLLEYWTNPEREKKLFFCQIEALETAIYLAEAAKKYGDAWIESQLHEANESSNPLLYRIAFKMATGSGKTVVMAMLIAWQALNKLNNRQDAKFSDTFLIVTPGITIRDRLRVLFPNDPGNYYRQRDILPPHLLQELQKAKLLITNFHTFLQREKTPSSKITKQILSKGEKSPFTESPDEMVRRACREFGNKTGIVKIPRVPVAQTLEQMDEVVSYAKNQNLGLDIPYTIDGSEHNYVPDFIVRIDDGRGPEDLLSLVLEVSGASRRDKDVKVATAKTLWIPAVNNHGGFGRWAYIEIKDPWNAKKEIRRSDFLIGRKVE